MGYLVKHSFLKMTFLTAALPFMTNIAQAFNFKTAFFAAILPLTANLTYASELSSNVKSSL